MIDSLKTLFKSFLQICLFRNGPQDLPTSNFLLLFVVVTSACMAVLLNIMLGPLQQALPQVALNLVTVCIITQIILRLYKKPQRFTQTLCAVLGTGIIITLFAFPLAAIMYYAKTYNVDASAVVFLWYILIAWEITVTAHILRHAINCSYELSFLLSVIYLIVILSLTNTLITTA